jgi:methyl-accepting chemotaxis protein
MLNFFNGRLSLATRLALVSLLFLGSAVFPTALLVMQADREVRFSEKERSGVDFLQEAWNATLKGGTVDTEAAEASFGAGAAAAALGEAVSEADQVAAGLKLIQQVADGSNLTLDPELDSFYAMDAATVRIPATLKAAREFEAMLQAQRESGNRDLEVKIAGENLRAAAAAAVSSMDASINNNASGETRAALEKPMAAIDREVAALLNSASNVDFGAQTDRFEAVLDESWKATAAELERLLNVRIDGLRSRLEGQLAVVGLLLAIACALAWFVSTGLAGRFKKLTASMDKLRAGDFQSEIPYTDDKNETGSIANTLSFLRDDVNQRIVKDAEQAELAMLGPAGYVKAISVTQAVVEYQPDGTLVTANENFLQLTGYSLEEVVGKSHAIFLSPEDARDPKQSNLWNRLNRGESVSGKFMSVGKRGGEIWLQASYNPIVDKNGHVVKVVQIAADITAAEMKATEQSACIDAIQRAQAVIEFKLDGTILTANENFLAAMGYTLNEIVGQNHTMFTPPGFASTPEYLAHWERLKRGEHVAGKFMRHAKGGREVWMEASYNLILDLRGNPHKVVKFANDITQVEFERRAAEAERAANAAAQEKVVSGLARGLSDLAAGNLTVRLEEPFPGQYETLRSDFNNAMDELQEAMRSIVGNAHGISSGASEISQAADDLSRRTEQQAASLEETAAALDQITATVRKAADNAKQASSIVAVARTDAEESRQVVNGAVAAMASINASSRQISQILGVIDEISFQTNLLALNAGVEAARAGDAGRGFAVVASEVRALAQRSSEAAKEIKELISVSSQHVGTGVDLVGKAGTALNMIVGKVGEISTLVAEIAVASQEQSSGLGEINTAINQMDQVTQQNAAMVEESTAASHQLKREAADLTELTARFQIGAALDRAATQRTATAAPKTPVHQQRQRVAQFAAQGSARPKATDGWEVF